MNLKKIFVIILAGLILFLMGVLTDSFMYINHQSSPERSGPIILHYVNQNGQEVRPVTTKLGKLMF